MGSLGSIVNNIWKNHKYGICTTIGVGLASFSITHFCPDLEGKLKYLVGVGLPTVTGAVLASVIDKYRKSGEQSKLETELSDLGHFSGGFQVGVKDRKIKKFIPGKSGLLNDLNFRAKSGDNLRDKYSESPEVAEFAEEAVKILYERYKNIVKLSEKNPKLMDKFNNGFRSEDPVTGRKVKIVGNVNNTKDFTETTYELEAFLRQDNETVFVKARPLFTESKMGVFRKIFDPKVVDHMQNDFNYYKKLQKVNVACLYCDIRGFTDWTEQNDVDAVGEMVTNYYKTLRAAASDFDLTYDKYVGDEILFVFGPPYDKKNPHSSMDIPVYNSINAAIKMREAFEKLSEGHNLGVGIGIDFGEAVMGVLSDDIVYLYTGFGRTYNQGARLCSEAESSEIIVSKRAINQLYQENKRDLDSRLKESGSVNVKGVKDDIDIYKVD